VGESRIAAGRSGSALFGDIERVFALDGERIATIR
jgi:hypothetical protein